jgi:phenylacetate-CoA ligase
MNKFLVKNVIAPLFALKNGEKYLNYLRMLRRTERMTRDELDALQLDKLKRMIGHSFESVPYYRRRFDESGVQPGDLQKLDDLSKFPVLTKSDMQTRLTEMVASGCPRETLFKNATGGSTGEPTIFYQDKFNVEMSRSSMWRCFGWVGVEIGDRQAMIWGSQFDVALHQKLRQRFRDWRDNMLVIPGFGLTDEKMAEACKTLIRFKPKAISGYTSMLEIFAAYLQKHPEFRIPVEAIVSSAETLTESQRSNIEDGFKCKVYNRYGGRELGCIAHECEAREGLHINCESMVVETVRDGKPCSPGEPGNILLTSLTNYGMPFIRYEVGDIGVLTDRECSCGRGLPMLSQVIGRVHDVIITADGEYLPGEFFPHLFKDFEGIKKYRVTQKTKTHLLIEIVADERFKESSLDTIKRHTVDAVGKEMKLEFQFKDRIDTPASGKHRFTVSELSKEELGLAPQKNSGGSQELES